MEATAISVKVVSTMKLICIQESTERAFKKYYFSFAQVFISMRASAVLIKGS